MRIINYILCELSELITSTIDKESRKSRDAHDLE